MRYNAICAADISEPDYMLPWSLEMLYQVEPELAVIAARAVGQKKKGLRARLDAYTAVKRDAGRLVGWSSRDPRLRSQGAWECYFRYILKELDL